jgi:UDP-N-acetylmuramoylalanine--D-glutamate ligase
MIINGQEVCHTNELKLLGEHNWQNACAAITAAWQVSQNVAAFREVLTTFAGLPFRIEFRQTVNDVRYFNDSFATAPGACVAAMKAIPGSKVVIIGGHDRGLDLTELATALNELKSEIRKVVLIGASARRTAKVLQENGITNYVLSKSDTMQAIVKEATSFAQPGDAVILSPAFASFGMFKNFEDRGNQFNDAVEAL